MSLPLPHGQAAQLDVPLLLLLQRAADAALAPGAAAAATTTTKAGGRGAVPAEPAAAEPAEWLLDLASQLAQQVRIG